MSGEGDGSRLRGRRRLVRAIALVLAAGGLTLILVPARVPAPARVLLGLGDLVAGAVLLLVARQKLPGG